MTSDILLIHLLLWYYYMCIIIHVGWAHTIENPSVSQVQDAGSLVREMYQKVFLSYVS